MLFQVIIMTCKLHFFGIWQLMHASLVWAFLPTGWEPCQETIHITFNAEGKASWWQVTQFIRLANVTSLYRFWNTTLSLSMIFYRVSVQVYWTIKLPLQFVGRSYIYINYIWCNSNWRRKTTMPELILLDLKTLFLNLNRENSFLYLDQKQ